MHAARTGTPDIANSSHDSNVQTGGQRSYEVMKKPGARPGISSVLATLLLNEPNIA